MKVLKYELIDHGIQHEQYFQGCGVSFTEYDECYTGMGNNAAEALEDAIEQAVCSGCVFPSELTTELQSTIDQLIAATPKPDEHNHTDCGDDDCYAEDTHYYASIRVKGVKS